MKGGKKLQSAKANELQRQRDAVPKSPPRLPVLYNGATSPQLEGFGGEEYRPDSISIISGRADPRAGGGNYAGRGSMDPGRGAYQAVNVPMPPMPTGPSWVDPYERTESMTHRGRYSYASSAISTINSPRRVRRRKDPTPFK